MAAGQLSYFRGRWPEEVVPEGFPEWMLYEVDRDGDNVLRWVEVFTDGKIERNSVSLEEQWGASCPSLLDSSFEEIIGMSVVHPILKADFEALWNQGVDTPFWEVGKPR
ncbi:hypothetical protein [Nitrospirillum iridis]|uniref:Uncharacterized protein n=1 Tax=Nitrospirillum iridis TaxID=765888 RepID=A0A7X0AZH2_9PROT|nr:hypothetical protein [Nitrospirillum iridis]MBB6252617.1 hypothetical protein [Nitrospirillum iridis]